MRHHIVIYGCQMNRSDAERIDGLFSSLGSQKTNNPGMADIIVTVMCSVRQMAADRVFGLRQKMGFAELKKKNPKFISILTGCIVEKDKESFSEIFDYILDIKKLRTWPKIIGLANPKASAGDYFRILPQNSSKFSALVPISKGCDNYCTYCVVPYTRGPLVSRPANDIIKECRLAASRGAKEIWLLGQNVNNYHWHDLDFAKLLRAVNDIPGVFWIRFTSPHPKDFDDAAVLSMAQCEKVTPYLNLPIQSGDDTVLKAMARPYTVAKYKNLVKKIRLAFKAHRKGMEKNIAISTDVIVGFPSETKMQFNNTAKTFKTVKYDMAYIAQYSRRAGTAAAKLGGNVTPQEKKRREEILNNILKTTALARCKKFVGKTVEVLVDSVKFEKKGGTTIPFCLGKNRHYKTVKFTVGSLDPHDLIGKFVKVRVDRAQSFGLIGQIEK